MAKVTMPQLGESVAEGTIGKWLKQPGDTVAKYEPLLEVITDKVNAEVPSPFAGVLKEILAEEGATVPNNAEIAVIETEEEAGGQLPSPPRRLRREAAPSATDDGGPKVEAPAETAATGGGSNGSAAPLPQRDRRPNDRSGRPLPPAAPSAPTATAPPATGDADARMSPAVRRLLREHELTAAQIVGTGQAGRITRDDVLAVVERMRTGEPAPAARRGRRRRAAPRRTAAPASPRPRRPHRAPVVPARRASRASSSPPAPTRSSSR